jgi:hypothetical protein
MSGWDDGTLQNANWIEAYYEDGREILGNGQGQGPVRPRQIKKLPQTLYNLKTKRVHHWKIVNEFGAVVKTIKNQHYVSPFKAKIMRSWDEETQLNEIGDRLKGKDRLSRFITRSIERWNNHTMDLHGPIDDWQKSREGKEHNYKQIQRHRKNVDRALKRLAKPTMKDKIVDGWNEETEGTRMPDLKEGKTLKRLKKSFRQTFKSEWPDKPKDKLDAKDALATAGYTGVGAAAGALTGVAVGLNPVAGAALGGVSALYGRLKKWRGNYRKLRQMGENTMNEADTDTDTDTGTDTETPETPESDSYNPHAELFQAILDDKPHDAKEVMDDILKGKLSYAVDDYKSQLASQMFGAAESEPETEPEIDPDQEVDMEVDENLKWNKGNHHNSVEGKDLPKVAKKQKYK